MYAIRSYYEVIAKSAMLRAEALFRSTVADNIDAIYADDTDSISTDLDTDASWWRDSSNWASNTTSFSALSEGAPQFRIEERVITSYSIHYTKLYELPRHPAAHLPRPGLSR